MMGMGPKSQRGGTWLYPPNGAELATVGLAEIGVYIARQQNMVEHYIATRHIIDLCLSAEQNPGLRLSRQWWDHPALDILGIIVGDAEEEEGGAEESEGYGEREGEK